MNTSSITRSLLQRSLLIITALTLASGSVVAQEETGKASIEFTEQQLEFFESKVRPLLVEHCNECHGPDAKPIEGGLNLASRKSIIAGGDTGPAIVPGHASESLLIDAINYGEVYEMPPDTKMTDEQIAVLTKWVNEGAPWPKSSDVEVAVKEAFDIKIRKAEHWCWKPVRKPAVPQVADAQWAQDPIDNFVLSRIENAGLNPAPATSRQTLIRRVYFDIVGLPPTPEQVQAFVDDPSKNAFEKVIDHLLESPRFGERWARHWMDLTRYAETGGHEFDYNIPYAHQYRDYLIRAFNADVPYKQLVHEHIAGDLIPNPRRHLTEDYNESILGTGFWFLGEAKHAPVDSKGEEARKIDNQIDVMSKTFLGLTVACARCHDHKFDAISTEDYYALAGFLQSSRRQAAMLDPGRKIEKKFEEAAKLVDLGGTVADKLIAQVIAAQASSEADDQTVQSNAASYFNAALESLRANSAWNQQPPLKIEGESLTQQSVDGGETLPQEIKKRGKFAWSGNQQYWWKHGQPGQSWALEFEAPNVADTEYRVAITFTMAGDYGAVQVFVDDQIVIEKLDFYDPELKTIKLDLPDLKLQGGKHVLKLKLLEPNEKAAPSNMVGIDTLDLTPVVQNSESEIALNQRIANRDKLDLELINKTIAAIKSADQSPASPMNLLTRASRNSQNVDAQLGVQIAQQAKLADEQHEKFVNDSELFADFENGLPAGWFRTGVAFGQPGADADSSFSATGPMIRNSGTVNSGQYSSKFQGVIRSPSFELKHSHIHYRMSGKNVSARLIIDGFTMDVYNALLFKGCKLNFRESAQLGWQSQAGDIGNHIGSRAHLEIIDHGDGFIALDQIRFSNGASPADRSAWNVDHEAGTPFESVKTLSDWFSQSTSQSLADDEQAGFYQALGAIVESDLVEIFVGKTTNKKTSLNRTRLSDRILGTHPISAARTPQPNSAAALAVELKAVRVRLAKLTESVPAPVMAIGMTDGTGEEEFIFIRGNHKTLGTPATRRFLSAISDRPLNPKDGSGRLLLANKITAPNNPLTNRVAVNRIWHHLFGKGIVESTDNFGVLGKPPTHPQLLDYLAIEFSRNGQSFKKTIKRLVMTATYQMDSKSNESADGADPDNNLLHRARIRRLQGEAIRDSILQASGRLDLKMYGNSVPIYLTSFMGGRGRPGASGPLDGDGRRTIYVSVRRNFLSPMMLAFDTPIPFNAIGKRNVSNVPAQALILMNDPFVIGQAKTWAEKLVTDGQSISERIASIYQTALGRAPTASELSMSLGFVTQQALELGIEKEAMQGDVQLWQDFCHVVFNLKEFIYIQ